MRFSLYVVYTVGCYSKYPKKSNVSDLLSLMTTYKQSLLKNTSILAKGRTTNVFGQRTVGKGNLVIVHACKNTLLFVELKFCLSKVTGNRENSDYF